MKILFIALHYHDYTHQIAEEMRLLGHEVSVHDIMPRSFAMRSLRVLAPARWQDRIDAHHRAILEAERGNHYDLVLFNQVHQMSQETLGAFRATFSGAKFTLYYWDSIANHDYLAHVHAFDTVLTFDPEDARRHGFGYLPLFCSRSFQNLARRQRDGRTVYFVGNVVNPRRYAALTAFRSYCAKERITLQEHAACTPPAFVGIARGGTIPTGLKFGSISRAGFMNMVETSAATFDFANHHQSGFTMRVFENLCAGKKIITNNPRVASADFYTPDRFLVFRDFDFAAVRDFLDLPLADEAATFPEYHIQQFARHLVDGTAHDFTRLLNAA